MSAAVAIRGEEWKERREATTNAREQEPPVQEKQKKGETKGMEGPEKEGVRVLGEGAETQCGLTRPRSPPRKRKKWKSKTMKRKTTETTEGTSGFLNVVVLVL